MKKEDLARGLRLIKEGGYPPRKGSNAEKMAAKRKEKQKDLAEYISSADLSKALRNLIGKDEE